MVKAVLRLLRLIPRALERAHLEWAIREVHPLHPDVPYIVQRLNELSRSEQ
jgi:hypothetical protein